MESPDTDETLMWRVMVDDRDAWMALYGRHAQALFQFLLKRTGSQEAAEEAHQETWLRVWRFRSRFDRTKRFKTWLYAIGINAGKDAARPQPNVLRFAGVHHDQVELRDQLVHAIHGLDPTDRRVVLLSVEGFSSDEMGEMTGLSAGAVRMRLLRARTALMEKLHG